MPDRFAVVPKRGQGALPTHFSRDSETAGSPVRIVVADHVDLDRAGLRALLAAQPGFSVVGEASCADECVATVTRHPGALLLMSVRLPNRLGRPALPEILRRLSGTRVVVLSDRGARDCMVLNPPQPQGLDILGPAPPCARGIDCLEIALDQGAHGVVRRSDDARALFEAILLVASGGRVGVGLRTAGEHDGSCDRRGADRLRLSPREVEVVALIARGRSNKEIAAALAIGLPTVKKHVGHALKKLRLQDRLQVGVFVARHPELLAADADPVGD